LERRGREARVASGAKGARRADVGDLELQAHLDELLLHGDVLVQQFVPAVEDEGELSVVLVDGRVAHGVRKLPAAGDFRVQYEWGGSSKVVTPTSSLAELATRVYDVLPAPAMYARIDFVAIGGRWHVMEVEVTEPALWLDEAPATTRLLADAIAARLSPQPA
jgi:glutathione synthase/RimK-type ligase-like ATP-grasp enzyme